MKYKVSILLVAVFAVTFSSCKKDGDKAPVAPLETLLDVINAGTDTVNIFQNGTRLNNTSAYFPGGTLGYQPVNAGEQSIQVKKAGTPIVLFDAKYTLVDSSFYSLFIAGQGADKIFLKRDSISNENKLAQIRFVNASPDASYDIKIGTTFSYSNRAFKSATDFVKMPVGNNTLTIYPAGSLTPIVTRTLNLLAAKAYTVYTKGKPGGTGNNAFAAVLIANL